MKTFEVGQRVQVKRLNSREKKSFARWARDSMPGRTGVVEEVKDDTLPRLVPREGKRYLVRFDKAIPPDRPGRLPTTHFHFEAKWLREVSK